MQKFRQSDSQHVRDKDGKPVNLNSLAGADYVLGLQNRVAELEAEQVKPKRGRPKKVGPKETK